MSVQSPRHYCIFFFYRSSTLLRFDYEFYHICRLMFNIEIETFRCRQNPGDFAMAPFADVLEHVTTVRPISCVQRIS